jgi:hypothetical protein
VDDKKINVKGYLKIKKDIYEYSCKSPNKLCETPPLNVKYAFEGIRGVCIKPNYPVMESSSYWVISPNKDSIFVVVSQLK